MYQYSRRILLTWVEDAKKKIFSPSINNENLCFGSGQYHYWSELIAASN